MKKVLLASTALVLSAGVAAADVSVGGDARMGVLDNFDPDAFGLQTYDDNNNPVSLGSSDLGFTSRIRISFSASGETDGGLAFGGSIRADNAGGGANGSSGNVFVEGAFGKLSMGDVDGAAEAAVGYVSGVGLTGLGDVNEILYIAGGGPDSPNMLYQYNMGDIGFYFSADNPGPSGSGDAWALGASYAFGAFSVGIGYEDSEAITLNVGPDDGVDLVTGASGDHLVLGGTAAFGDATIKVQYGDGAVDGGPDITQYAGSLDYVFGATTLTAFYRKSEVDTVVEIESYGIGAAYDLGGGAALKAGWSHLDLSGITATDSQGNVQGNGSDDAFDFGISMSF